MTEGWVAVYPLINQPFLIAKISLSLVRVLMPGAIAARVRSRRSVRGMIMPKPQRFSAEILMGHKGAAVIVPFDPAG